MDQIISKKWPKNVSMKFIKTKTKRITETNEKSQMNYRRNFQET